MLEKKPESDDSKDTTFGLGEVAHLLPAVIKYVDARCIKMEKIFYEQWGKDVWDFTFRTVLPHGISKNALTAWEEANGVPLCGYILHMYVPHKEKFRKSSKMWKQMHWATQRKYQGGFMDQAVFLNKIFKCEVTPNKDGRYSKIHSIAEPPLCAPARKEGLLDN